MHMLTATTGPLISAATALGFIIRNMDQFRALCYSLVAAALPVYPETDITTLSLTNISMSLDMHAGEVASKPINRQLTSMSIV